MRLIGITRNCSQVCQRLLGMWPACDIQKTLKAQHRLKYLRTITNGGRESPVQLPVADSDPLTELLNSAMRVASKPSDAATTRSGGSASAVTESFNER